jgi:hypothetical protein
MFSLSGRIQSRQAAELRILLESEHRRVVLDLKEVTLVDRDAVQFIRHCESRGTELRNCPAYVSGSSKSDPEKNGQDNRQLNTLSRRVSRWCRYFDIIRHIDTATFPCEHPI